MTTTKQAISLTPFRDNFTEESLLNQLEKDLKHEWSADNATIGAYKKFKVWITVEEIKDPT